MTYFRLEKVDHADYLRRIRDMAKSSIPAVASMGQTMLDAERQKDPEAKVRCTSCGWEGKHGETVRGNDGPACPQCSNGYSLVPHDQSDSSCMGR